jgi:hypothetical protein
MNEFPPLLAAWNIEEMRGQVLLGVRIVACVVGAAVGWFIASPLFRGLYRLYSPRKGIPGMLLFPLRLLSAAGIAAVVYFWLPLGFGGGGGLGSGGGTGDGDGPFKGTGNGANSADPNSTSKPNDNAPQKTNALPKPRDPVVIELVPSKVEKKYYLVKHKDRQDPPRNFEEVEKLIKENKDNYEVRITFGPNAPSSKTLTFRRLIDLLEELKIPHTKEKE